jgi:hypothetical protein
LSQKQSLLLVRTAALRQEEVSAVVLGMLPALDATRCLLSVEAPAAAGPNLLSLNPVEVRYQC